MTSRAGVSWRRLAWPIVLSAAVLLTALLPASPVLDAESAAPPLHARLHLPIGYLLLAPLCDVMDEVSLFSGRQHAALVVLAALALAAHRLRAASMGRGRGRREIYKVLFFLGAAVAFYGVLLIAPRPMASLAVDDPEIVRVDFHSHTSASWDARSEFTAEKNRAWHRDAGFDAAYVSDHKETYAAAAGARINPKTAGEGTVILTAVEVSLWRKTVAIGGTIAESWRPSMEARIHEGKATPSEVLPGSLLILTIPGDVPDLLPAKESFEPKFSAVEISDGAPRGLQQSMRDRKKILALADRHDLAVVAGTNNHGWGRTACAWNLIRIPGWRSMSAGALDAEIVRTLKENRRHAVEVVERRLPYAGTSALAGAAAIPLAAWQMLAGLSLSERLSWLIWIWIGAALAAASHSRSRSRAAGAWPLAIGITLASAVGRLLMAVLIPLVPDETYYWEWSRHPASGYFDHPPGVAVLIRSGVALFGATPFGVRFFSVLAGLVACCLMVSMARRLGGDAAALRAAAILACLPFAAAGLVVAVPDAPLLALLAGAVTAILNAVEKPKGSRKAILWWCLAGLLAGAGLFSKYTAILLPAGVFVAFLVIPSLRERLKGAGPYVAAAIAAALFLPVVIWNAQHSWASFRFQLHHGLGSGQGSALAREVSLLIGQAALGSPILLAMMLIAVASYLRARPPAEGRLLAILTLVSMIFFVVSALRKPVAPNWTGPAYITGIVLLASAAGGVAWRRWLRAGCVLGAILAILIYAHAIYPVVKFRGSSDPIGRAYGWDALAEHAMVARDAIRAASGGAVWIAADNYEDASELAFNLPDHPPVFSLNLAGRPNQYDFWPGFSETARAGDDLVLVLREHKGAHPAIAILAPHFTSVQEGATVELGRGKRVISKRRIWILEGWRGSWPERPRGS